MKNLLLAVCAVFAFATVNAQDISIGAKAGVNFASVGGDDTDDLDGLTSFHFGAVAEIGISEKFSFQPELLYSAQGASFDNVDLNLDYLTVPLMAKYYVTEGLSIEAGPQIGFLLSSKVDGEDVSDFTSGVDFGLGLGLGYKLDNGLNFAARYNFGLSNINDGFEGADDISNQNNVFQLSVGYFFL